MQTYRPPRRGTFLVQDIMFNRYARAPITRLLTPVARALLALGISPDVVTLVGTLGVCAGALVFYPRGDFLVGTLVITAFVFSDTLDGTMARASGRSSAWGAFLDSTLDRIGDASIFGGLVLYFAGRGRDEVMAALALACLVFGAVVSYARARAEGLGLRADVGIAERTERLVVVLVTTGLTGLFGLPHLVLKIVLALLAVASAVTVAQRMLTVRRQVLAQHAGLAQGPPPTDTGPPAPDPTTPAATAPGPATSGPIAPGPTISGTTAPGPTAPDQAAPAPTAGAGGPAGDGPVTKTWRARRTERRGRRRNRVVDG